MALGLFSSKPVLDETASLWIFDAYEWALHNFDAALFYQETQLVLPTNDFFPGRVDSVEGMASLVFEKVKHYAAISHWPTRLQDHNSCVINESSPVEIQGALRAPSGTIPANTNSDNYLTIPYNPEQINNPEGLIASYAHIISHYMGQMAETTPPGGVEYWPQTTELLAIYLGFGLMFANSAYTFRGGCGSCYNPRAQRDAYLTEVESTYALAVFSVLKNISGATVKPHLKKHLRGIYKRAEKEIRQRESIIDRLRQSSTAQSNHQIQ